MKLPVLFTLLTKALSQIVFTFTAQPFSGQCVNNKLSIFGLNLFIKGSVNGISFVQPMGELGLPIVNMDWFVNGNPANQLAVMQNFNVDGSTTSGNRWSFQLKDDQPNIGAGIITLGPCVQGTMSSVTASFSTTSFIVGVGFPSLNLPPASGVPSIVNNLSPQNIPGGTTAIPQVITSSVIPLPTTTTLLRPTTLVPPLPTTTGIVFTISSVRLNKQCVNGKLSVFGLNMSVKGSVNGVVFNLPMGEIGLPIINMNWFVNGNPANQLVVLQSFNVGGSTTNQNTWTFQLQNDQPTIGAGTITLGPCVQGTIYTITVSLATTSFIVGVGVPQSGIPPASGVPVIVNNLVF